MQKAGGCSSPLMSQPSACWDASSFAHIPASVQWVWWRRIWENSTQHCSILQITGHERLLDFLYEDWQYLWNFFFKSKYVFVKEYLNRDLICLLTESQTAVLPMGHFWTGLFPHWSLNIPKEKVCVTGSHRAKGSLQVVRMSNYNSEKTVLIFFLKFNLNDAELF